MVGWEEGRVGVVSEGDVIEGLVGIIRDEVVVGDGELMR